MATSTIASKMEIGFPGPHPPYDPIPRYAESYLEKELPLAGQPPPFQVMRVHNVEVDHDSVVHVLEPTHEQRHRQRAYYLANVTMIDEKVGEILNSRDAKGYLDDAVVIFTSDHGDALGDHGHSQKWTMYDIVTRVPLIVWSPGRIDSGRNVDGLCQLMDLGPMIMEFARVNVPEAWEAESIKPALTADDWPGRAQVFAEHGRDGILQATEFMTMIRDREWKLVHFLDEPFGQLFNLANDPGETRNLWDDPDHAGKKEELLGTIREWRIRSGYQTSSWAAAWR